MKDELGVTLDKADESVLGLAAKVVVGKESCTIVGDGRTQVRVCAGGRGPELFGWGVMVPDACRANCPSAPALWKIRHKTLHPSALLLCVSDRSAPLLLLLLPLSQLFPLPSLFTKLPG